MSFLCLASKIITLWVWFIRFPYRLTVFSSLLLTPHNLIGESGKELRMDLQPNWFSEWSYEAKLKATIWRWLYIYQSCFPVKLGAQKMSNDYNRPRTSPLSIYRTNSTPSTLAAHAQMCRSRQTTTLDRPAAVVDLCADVAVANVL